MSNTEVMKQSAVKLAGKHPKNKIHRTAGDIAFDVFLYILFVAFTILCVFPFYYLFINTISSNDAVAGGLVNFWPVGIHFQNYLALRDVADLGSSVIVTVAPSAPGVWETTSGTLMVVHLVTSTPMTNRPRMEAPSVSFCSRLPPISLTILTPLRYSDSSTKVSQVRTDERSLPLSQTYSASPLNYQTISLEPPCSTT